MMKTAGRAIALTVAAVTALTLSGCAGSVSVQSQAPPKPVGTKTGHLSRQHKAALPRIGTVYKITGVGANNATITVKLTRVIDPAQGADQFTQPDAGKRFVAAVFRIKGVLGTASDDANGDVTLVGSNGQDYQFDSSDITGYTNFNYGEFTVSPGQHGVGAVVFQVPDRVKVAQVQWSGSGGFGGTPATWAVHK